MNFRDLILDHSTSQIKFRPYRLHGESTAAYRESLGDAAPEGPFVVDLAPPLEEFANFVEKLTRARLMNVNRSEIEVEYRKGLWDDAWDGFFYYPALLLSHLLSYDERLLEAPEFSGDLLYYDGVRGYRNSRYIFLKKGELTTAHDGNSLTLPIQSLSNGTNDLNLADVAALFGTNLIADLRAWIGIEHGSPRAPQIIGKGKLEFDVFLSHSSRDAKEARDLAKALTAAGKRVFFSPESLPALGSTEYMKVIDDAIDKSKHFILFGTSKENLLSSWVEAEWRLFINEKRSGRKSGNFLTTVTPNVTPAELPVSLRYYEVVPLHGDHFETIVKYII